MSALECLRVDRLLADALVRKHEVRSEVRSETDTLIRALALLGKTESKSRLAKCG